jgi:uncharacterized protein YbjT (DUF2867 family)
MTGKVAAVFGGSGFVGRSVVRALCKQGWRVRVAMRRPHLGGDLRLAGDVGQVQLVQANIRNRPSVQRALQGVDAVVNLVGSPVERGPQSFTTLHVEGARNLAELASAAGIGRFIQISGIGASPDARSRYARSRGEGDRAVTQAYPTATVLKPSIIFGPEDAFFTRFAQMARLSPVLPVIGSSVRYQPAHVNDVADAVAAALGRPETAGRTYELGGPRAYTMKELLTFLTAAIARPRLLLPVPFSLMQPVGYFIGGLSRLIPFFPQVITGDQVQLLRSSNTVAPGALGFADLGLTQLHSMESSAPTWLWRHRPLGQFQKPLIEEPSRVDA